MVKRRRASRSLAQRRADQPFGRHLAAADLCASRILLAAAAAGFALTTLMPMRAMAQQLTPPGVVTAIPSDAQTDPSHLQGIHDYLDTSLEPVEISQLGILARDGHSTLDDGEQMAGVMVVDVAAKSAAANALGSHDVSNKLVGGVLLGAGLASAVLFPPALIGVVMLANSHVGMSYDLVVGVDGRRVRNTMELMQSVGDARPGDTLYLAIVRGGRRHQIAVPAQ